MVNVIKFQTLFLSFSQICCLSGLELTKCVSVQQTGKTLIRLLLQMQSDLDLHCLYRPFYQAKSVGIFRTLTIYGLNLLVSYFWFLKIVINIAECVY